jgi:hypothetical protein
LEQQPWYFRFLVNMFTLFTPRLNQIIFGVGGGVFKRTSVRSLAKIYLNILLEGFIYPGKIPSELHLTSNQEVCDNKKNNNYYSRSKHNIKIVSLICIRQTEYISVAQFHYDLSTGAIFAITAGFILYNSKVNEKVGKISYKPQRRPNIRWEANIKMEHRPRLVWTGFS